MAEFDPIANIKRFSPTAHLQKREADTGTALQRLMSGRLIQSDKDIAAGQRQTGVNQANIDRAFITGGALPGDTAGLQAALDATRRDRMLQARAAAARGGMPSVFGKTGTLGIGELPTADIKQGPFPGAAAAEVTARVQAELERQRKKKYIAGPGGKQVGSLAQVEESERQKIIGKAKNVDPEIAKGIINAVKSKFPELADKQGFDVKDLGDKWRVEIEGRIFEWPKS
jgi:hypothetical protein